MTENMSNKIYMIIMHNLVMRKILLLTLYSFTKANIYSIQVMCISNIAEINSVRSDGRAYYFALDIVLERK